jgi:hypothetical protein
MSCVVVPGLGSIRVALVLLIGFAFDFVGRLVPERSLNGSTLMLSIGEKKGKKRVAGTFL